MIQLLVYNLTHIITIILNISKTKSITITTNIFINQTKTPLIIQPYLKKITQSKLNTLITNKFTTITKSILTIYIKILKKKYKSHLLTTSIISAPTAFLITKIILPKTKNSITNKQIKLQFKKTTNNIIKTTTNNTTNNLKL